MSLALRRGGAAAGNRPSEPPPSSSPVTGVLERRESFVCVVGALEREVEEGYEEKNRSSTFISFFWTGFFFNKPDSTLLDRGSTHSR